MLEDIDPVYAAEIHPNNRFRVIRAIEVKKLTGKSKQDFVQEKKLKYDILFLTPYNKEREKLYERIGKRVDIMVEQ